MMERHITRFLFLSYLTVTNGFFNFSPRTQLPRQTFLHSTNSVAETPSWDELSSLLEQDSSPTPSPILTLYRDTNGWCPFCERVWLALEIKGIPYKESLINLQNKPDWFLEMVPTGLVPAVMFYDEKTTNSVGDDNAKPQRTLIWESLDIMKALDELFPDTEKLILDDLPKYKEGEEIISRLSTAGFQYLYSGRNDTLTEEDKKQLKLNFQTTLDEFDAFIASNEGGPFILGSKVSGIDVQIIPAMERLRYQLPITVDMNIMEGRPNLQKWFEEGMDTLGAYANRVAGDKYSWTAVSSFFLKVFSSKGPNGEVSSETAVAIKRSDESAAALVKGFSEEPTYTVTKGSTLSKEEITRSAVSKIIANHDNVIKDCTSSDPKTQTNLKRANSSDSADIALRAVAMNLLNEGEGETSYPSFESTEDALDAAVAMKTIAQRLCVPRDMGGPSAAVLRKTLMAVAECIESDAKA